MKRAVPFACAGGHKVRYTGINTHHWSIWFRLHRDEFIVSERQPPPISTLVELYTAIDLFVFECLMVVLRQLHRNQDRLAFLKRTDGQPVVERGIP